MPPQTTRPPFRTALSACTSAPTGADPARTKRKREFLCALVTRARKGVNLSILPPADLRQNVRGSAKTIKADALSISRHTQ